MTVTPASATSDHDSSDQHPPEGDGHPAVALGLLILTALVAAFAFVLLAINRPQWHVGQWYFLVDVADGVVFGIVGYVLLSRSRHIVAWIVSVMALGGAVAAVGAQWTELTYRHPGVAELRGVQATQSWAWVPGTLALILVVPWLVREGPLRWYGKLFVALGATASVSLVVVRWTDPFPWPDGPSYMPLAIHNEAWIDRIDHVVRWHFAATVVLGLVAAAAVTVRWSVRTPDSRRGLGWLAIATALMTVTFAPLALPDGWTDFLPPNATPITHLASQLFYPGALLVAVLGQRLWGLRLAASRALAWSLLTGGLVAGYVSLIALSGLVFPGVTSGVEQVAVTALLAGAIEPLRRFVQRRVDHLVHGEGTEPIRVVGRVGRSIGAGGSPDQLLTGVLDDLVASLRLRGAHIEAEGMGSDLHQVAVGDTTGGDELMVPLALDDEPVGRLHLWPRHGERIDGQTERTVAALAPLVAVATRLAATAVALTESRSRLATARDEERRALRRELHDGLGPALAGVGYGLQATRNLLDTNPEVAATLLDRLIGELDARVADVRSLARELVPPVLLEDGLPAALAELAERQRMTGLTVDLDLDVGDLPELGTQLATSLYAVAVEALRNVVRHAGATACRISLTAPGPSRVRLAIADDGVGIGPDAAPGVGTQSMRERADSMGAELAIGAAPGGGTLVEMRVDLGERP
ncbi:MAG TPA: sensor histidine kinase [Ilumatobacter sp.]|nr:sensor histidine kinase [Ilumatobacter sp.]